jgi:threonylcarbamoyladenosine tRNA methylthiotransferase MtaB
MPELGGHVIAERAARLRSFGARTLKRYLAGEIGKMRSVLVERGGRGHTECFAPVRFAHEVEPRSLVSARITAAAADHLIARSLP